VQRVEVSADVATHARLPEEGFVRLPAILALYPVGRSTWWAGVKAGRYPAPVKLGPRITAWRVEDIRALLSK
jgi:prophage regulatory protein